MKSIKKPLAKKMTNNPEKKLGEERIKDWEKGKSLTEEGAEKSSEKEKEEPEEKSRKELLGEIENTETSEDKKKEAQRALGEKALKEFKDSKKREEDLLKKGEKRNWEEQVELERIQQRVKESEKEFSFEKAIDAETEGEEKEDFKKMMEKLGETIAEKKKELEDKKNEAKDKAEEVGNIPWSDKSLEEQKELEERQKEFEKKEKRIIKELQKETCLDLFDWAVREKGVERNKEIEKKRRERVEKLQKEGARWEEKEVEGKIKDVFIPTEKQVKRAEKEMDKGIEGRKKEKVGVKGWLSLAIFGIWFLLRGVGSVLWEGIKKWAGVKEEKKDK